jgi:hypothetical protein
MKRIAAILVGMATMLLTVIVPSVANAAAPPAPPTPTVTAPAAAGGFAPIGTPITLHTPAQTVTMNVQRVVTGDKAPVGAPIPGANGMVVGPNNSVVTKAQLSAMRHGKHVVLLAGAYLYQVQVQGEMCGYPLGCSWDWWQWLGPVDYWGYGSEIWHGWVGSNYWPNDNLEGCSNHGGFFYSVTTSYCSWQGANPTAQDMDIALWFQTHYFQYTFVSTYWMHIEIGSLGWTLTTG